MQTKQHTIVFSETDLVILDKALTSLPYREVAELIQKINKQLNENIPVMEIPGVAS